MRKWDKKYGGTMGKILLEDQWDCLGVTEGSREDGETKKTKKKTKS